MSASPAYRGACLCGGVTFSLTGAAKWVAYCHCSMCRRAHGAGSVAWVGFDRASQFHLDTGAELLHRYDSSPHAHRSFCSRCGSPLFFEGDRWANEIHIALASMIEPHGLVPKRHAYFDDRAPWVHVNDGLARYGGPQGNTPLDPPKPS